MIEVKAILVNGSRPSLIIRDDTTNKWAYVLKNGDNLEVDRCSEHSLESACAKYGYEPVRMPLFSTLDAAWSEAVQFSEAASH